MGSEKSKPGTAGMADDGSPPRMADNRLPPRMADDGLRPRMANDGLPPRIPPVGRRLSVFESWRFRDVDRHAGSAPKHLNESFDDLVSYLMEGLSSDLQKVRAVYMWLSTQNFLNTDVEDADDITPAGFLAVVALKKRDLAQLFHTLCTKAGLCCVVLQGYCKWFDYGQKPKEATANSTWNAVYIDGSWRIVHLAMAFRNLRLQRCRDVIIETTGEIVQDGGQDLKVAGYTDGDYFLCDPDEFIYMCRPERDDFQLLGDEAWDWDSYIQAPMYKPTPSRPPSPPDAHIEALDVPDCEENYPPPKPPASRKLDIQLLGDFSDVSDRGYSATDLYYDYKKLFGHLFDGLTSKVKKLRALLVWFTQNSSYGRSNVTREMKREATDPNTPVGAIKLMSQEKLSQAQFLAILCRRAGFPCVVIRGRIKRADVYQLGQTTCDRKEEWNAVYLDNNWRLINTRDAVEKLSYEEFEEAGAGGIFRLERKIYWRRRGKPDEFFFLTDPEKLIHFCLPDKPEWQLLHQSITEQQFFGEPWIQPPYFQSPWQLRDKQSVTLTAPDGVGSLVLEVKSKTDQKLRYNLFFRPEPGTEFPQNVQLKSYITTTSVSQNPVKMAVFTRLPVVGTYLLEVLDSAGQTAFKMLVRCEGDVQNQRQFPENPNGSFGPGKEAEDAGLCEPSHKRGVMVAMPGERVQPRFKLRVPKSAKASMAKQGRKPKLLPAEEERAATPKTAFTAKLAHATHSSEGLEKYVTLRQSKTHVEVDVKVPEDVDNPEFSLQINACEKDGAGDSVNVVNYFLTSDYSMAAAAAGVGVAQLKKEELADATEDGNMHRLEAAIREVRHASPPIPGDGVQEQAVQQLLGCYQQAIKDMETKCDLESFVELMTRGQSSAINDELQTKPWFSRAEDCLDIAKAANRGDITRLEEAVCTSREDRMPQAPLEGKVQLLAQERLLELHRQACEKAMANGNAKDLESAITAAHESEVAYFIHKTDWFSRAEQTLRSKRRREAEKQQKRRLNSDAIATRTSAAQPARSKTGR